MENSIHAWSRGVIAAVTASGAGAGRRHSIQPHHTFPAASSVGGGTSILASLSPAKDAVTTTSPSPQPAPSFSNPFAASTPDDSSSSNNLWAAFGPGFPGTSTAGGANEGSRRASIAAPELLSAGLGLPFTSAAATPSNALELPATSHITAVAAPAHTLGQQQQQQQHVAGDPFLAGFGGASNDQPIIDFTKLSKELFFAGHQQQQHSGLSPIPEGFPTSSFAGSLGTDGAAATASSADPQHTFGFPLPTSAAGSNIVLHPGLSYFSALQPRARFDSAFSAASHAAGQTDGGASGEQGDEEEDDSRTAREASPLGTSSAFPSADPRRPSIATAASELTLAGNQQPAQQQSPLTPASAHITAHPLPPTLLDGSSDLSSSVVGDTGALVKPGDFAAAYEPGLSLYPSSTPGDLTGQQPTVSITSPLSATGSIAVLSAGTTPHTIIMSPEAAAAAAAAASGGALEVGSAHGASPSSVLSNGSGPGPLHGKALDPSQQPQQQQQQQKGNSPHASFNNPFAAFSDPFAAQNSTAGGTATSTTTPHSLSNDGSSYDPMQTAGGAVVQGHNSQQGTGPLPPNAAPSGTPTLSTTTTTPGGAYDSQHGGSFSSNASGHGGGAAGGHNDGNGGRSGAPATPHASSFSGPSPMGVGTFQYSLPPGNGGSTSMQPPSSASSSASFGGAQYHPPASAHQHYPHHHQQQQHHILHRASISGPIMQHAAYTQQQLNAAAAAAAAASTSSSFSGVSGGTGPHGFGSGSGGLGGFFGGNGGGGAAASSSGLSNDMAIWAHAHAVAARPHTADGLFGGSFGFNASGFAPNHHANGLIPPATSHGEPSYQRPDSAGSQFVSVHRLF